MQRPGNNTPKTEILELRLTDYLRRLGLFDASMVVMGGIIGGGIFLNPSIVAQRIATACTSEKDTGRFLRRAHQLWLDCAVEHPHVVLLSVGSAQLFGRAKAASTFLQFIAKNDRHLTVRGRDLVCEDQGLAVPL